MFGGYVFKIKREEGDWGTERERERGSRVHREDTKIAC
jgi:hypothetical protein